MGSATSTTSGSLFVVGMGASDSVEVSECSKTAGLLLLFVIFLLCLGIVNLNFNIQLKFKNMMKTVLMWSCGETVTD